MELKSCDWHNRRLGSMAVASLVTPSVCFNATCLPIHLVVAAAKLLLELLLCDQTILTLVLLPDLCLVP